MSKILIIEDDPGIIETLGELLTLENYDVISATDGRDGVRKALKNSPDLIVCDIMMPEIDGYEVLKTLRQHPSTFSVPFLFLTAKSEKTDIRMGMGMGADDYISKPYDEEDILNAIESRLQKNKDIKKFYDNKIESLHNYIAATLPDELRVPLNTVIGFTSLLKNRYKQLSEAEMETIHDNIYNAGQRLLRLIANYTYYVTLIDISVSENKYPGDYVEHPQTLIYNQIIETAGIYSRGNDVRLELADAPLRVVGSHLLKISRELADNAFKYSRQGSEVYVRSYIEKSDYIISVKNTGPGMTAEQINNIAPFVKFLPDSSDMTGSGLGLSIVKKITDIYKGSFEITSEPGKTTEVTVKLPLKNVKV